MAKCRGEARHIRPGRFATPTQHRLRTVARLLVQCIVYLFAKANLEQIPDRIQPLEFRWKQKQSTPKMVREVVVSNYRPIS